MSEAACASTDPHGGIAGLRHMDPPSGRLPVPDGDIVVQTDDVCRLSGGCYKCPAHALAKDVRRMELNPLEHSGAITAVAGRSRIVDR